MRLKHVNNTITLKHDILMYLLVTIRKIYRNKKSNVNLNIDFLVFNLSLMRD